jgi:hypothetical protein
VRQKRLACFHEDGKRYDDDLFVSLTIYDIPDSLLRDFCRKIVQPNYPSGVSDAIKDLMRKAILEQQTSYSDATVLANEA